MSGDAAADVLKMYATKAVVVLSDPRPKYLEVDGTSVFLCGKDGRRKQFSMSTVVEAYESKAFVDNLARTTIGTLINGESATILVMGTQGTGKTRLSSYQSGILEALLTEVTTSTEPSHSVTFSAFELFDDVIIDHFAPEDDFESTIGNMKVTKVQLADKAQSLTLLEYVRNLSKNYTEIEATGVAEPAPSSSTMCFKIQLYNQATGAISTVTLIDSTPGPVLHALTTGLLDVASSGQNVEFFINANPVPMAPITQLVLPILARARPILIGMFNGSSESGQYAETLLATLHICKTSLESTKTPRNRMHPPVNPPREVADIIDSDLQKALDATIRSRPSVSSPLLPPGRDSLARDDDMRPDMGMLYEDKSSNRFTKTSEPHYDGLYPSFNSIMHEQKTPPQVPQPRPAGFASPASTSLRPEVELFDQPSNATHIADPSLYGVQEINELTGQAYIHDAHNPAYTMSTDVFPSVLASSGVDNTAHIISVKHNIVPLDPVVETNISPSVFNSLHAESALAASNTGVPGDHVSFQTASNIITSPKVQPPDSNHHQETVAMLASRFLETFRANVGSNAPKSSKTDKLLESEDIVSTIDSLALEPPQISSQSDLQALKEKLSTATQALERATLYRDELLARITDIECQGQEALLVSELHMMAAQKRATDIRKIISASIGATNTEPGSLARTAIPVADVKRLLDSHEEDISQLEKKLYTEIKAQAEEAIASALDYNKQAASRSLEDAQVKALVNELRKTVDMRLRNEVKLRQLQRQERELSAKMLLFKEIEKKHTVLKQERSGKVGEVRQIKETHKKLQHQNLTTQAQLDGLKKQLASATATLQEIKLDASSLRVAFQNLEHALADHGPEAVVFPAYQTNVASVPLEKATVDFMHRSAEAGSAFAVNALRETQVPAEHPGAREESLTVLEHVSSLVEDVLEAIRKKSAATGLTTDERRVKACMDDVLACLTKAIRARTAGTSANNYITDYNKYTVSLPQAATEPPPTVNDREVPVSSAVDIASRMISGAMRATGTEREGCAMQRYQTEYTMASLERLRVAAPDAARVAELGVTTAQESVKTAMLNTESKIATPTSLNQPVGAQMRTPLTDTLQAVQSVEKGIEERLRRLMSGYKEGVN